VNREALVAAYERMWLIRRFEERLNELFLSGQVAGTTNLCIGQEACAVGTCMALEKEDVVFSNHRGHGHLLGRDAEPRRVLAEICGQPGGYSGGRGGSQHMAIRAVNFGGTHGITAGTIPLATGVGLHGKLRGEPGAGVVFFGDGGVGEGIFHESLNMAALWGLRVLYVCENNEYAMSTAHRHASPVADVATRAAAYGMHSEIVDGNDVQAVYAAVRRLRTMMAEKPQPVLVELKTYRISGHSRGDKCEYRERDEEALWRERDPLLVTRQALQGDGWSDEDEESLIKGVEAVVADAESWALEGEGSVA
jgi:pyruvate dehydrogenase E1 component alpha subunit